MTTYTVAAGDRAKYEADLVADTETRVTFTDKFTDVEIVVHSAESPVYYTLDGTVPTVAGAKCRMLPAAPTTRRERNLIFNAGSALVLAAPVDVRMISEGAAVVSVYRV